MPTPPAFDPEIVPEAVGSSGYPEPFRALCAGRRKRRLGDAAGLRNFGVNLVTLDPSAWSSVRHWHERQDEFIYVLEGEIVLVTDAGEQVLTQGMVAGFPAGKPDGHHLVNRSGKPARYLEIGDRSPGDQAHYPDADLHAKHVAGIVFTRKSGEPY